MSASKKTVYAGVEVSDIGGVVASSDGHDGLGNRMLAGIREVDALCLVVRSFVDDTVPGETDPVAGLESLELELILGDVASLETQIARAKKASRCRPRTRGRSRRWSARRRCSRRGSRSIGRRFHERFARNSSRCSC